MRLSWKAHNKHVYFKSSKSITVLYCQAGIGSDITPYPLLFISFPLFQVLCEILGSDDKTLHSLFILHKKGVCVVHNAAYRDQTNSVLTTQNTENYRSGQVPNMTNFTQSQNRIIYQTMFKVCFFFGKDITILGFFWQLKVVMCALWGRVFVFWADRWNCGMTWVWNWSNVQIIFYEIQRYVKKMACVKK